MIILNGKEVIIKKFPNNESLIKIEDFTISGVNKITVRFDGDEDLIHLMFIKKYIDELGFSSILQIPYMPYSRMDRTGDENIFTLKYICDFINLLNFKSVEILEPHSDVSTALLNKVKVKNIVMPFAVSILDALTSESSYPCYILYPDAGAHKRYGSNLAYPNFLVGNKVRDFSTGKILSFEISGNIPNEPFNAIIVDDLCSKGGTFILASEQLKKMGAKSIQLVVAHCENTIFEGELLTSNLVDKIYTTNSILSKQHEKIKILDIGRIS